MHARDSSGRSVSLLNDEEPRVPSYSPRRHYTYTDSSRSDSSSSPITPGFTRADSYDSYIHRSYSPSTSIRNHCNRHAPYQSDIPHLQPLNCNYSEKINFGDKYLSQRSQGRHSPSSYDVQDTFTEPLVYDEDSYSLRSATSSERGAKRYPCRYRDSHHCQKTFTTSGHASRHSKIHTAEKGVSCTWEGCNKKFTRSDNMKQHLETHTKEKARPVKSSATTASSRTATTSQARIKKPASPSIKSCHLTPQYAPAHVLPKMDPRPYPLPGSSTISPLNPSLFNGLQPRIVAYSAPVVRPKGLDALAFAATNGSRT